MSGLRVEPRKLNYDPFAPTALIATEFIEAGLLIFSEDPYVSVSIEHKSSQIGNFLNAHIPLLSFEQQGAFWSLRNAYQTLGALGVFFTSSITLQNEDGILMGHIGEWLTMLRHDCSPNVKPLWDETEGRVQIRAIRNILPGEVLTRCFISEHAIREERRDELSQCYGIDCSCRFCSLTGEARRQSDFRRLYIHDAINDFETMLDDPEFLGMFGREALKFMDMEEIFEGKADLCYMIFKACVRWGDADNAKLWGEEAVRLTEILEGVGSLMFQRTIRNMATPENLPDFEEFGTDYGIGGPPPKLVLAFRPSAAAAQFSQFLQGVGDLSVKTPGHAT